MISVILLLINLASIYLNKVLGLESRAVNALVHFFDASQEQALPTLFSALLLFITALLSFTIYHVNEGRRRRGWLFLTLIFIFLMIDEFARIHEQFNRLRPYVQDSSGHFYYTWIIPYAVLTLVVGAILLRFIWSLPVNTRNQMLIAGIIFVTAAIGFEIMEGISSAENGTGNLNDKLLTAGEEFLEMLGVILMIDALLQFLARGNAAFLFAGRKTH